MIYGLSVKGSFMQSCLLNKIFANWQVITRACKRHLICKSSLFHQYKKPHCKPYLIKEIWFLSKGKNTYRPHTTVKNARNMKSVLRAILPYFERDLRHLNTRAARTALSSNFDQFCKPKLSCFMRETAVKRVSFFLEFLCRMRSIVYVYSC